MVSSLFRRHFCRYRYWARELFTTSLRCRLSGVGDDASRRRLLRFATQPLRLLTFGGTACGGAAALRLALRPSPPLTTNIDEPDVKLPRRLRRFHAFSSIEYNGVEYMTPRDFLDSIILDSPRERVFRRVITKGQLRSMLNATPPLRKGSSKMFRTLGDNGLISYAEYLFLITLLTKSQYAFNIAFLMFDEDENHRIDKKEFLLICTLLIAGHLNVKGDQFNDEFLQSCSLVNELDMSLLQHLTRRFSLAESADPNYLKGIITLLESLVYNSQNRFKIEKSDESDCNLDSLKEDGEYSPRDTTVMVHLFGRSGNGSMSLDQFQLFYNNLQREIIEIEFNEFARGKSEISSVDFARLVLRYSILHKSDHAQYIQRIYERSGFEEEGITLQQFEQFSMFLNNLEEFAKAVRLYTVADIPVSRTEFIRAVRCSTGFELNPHLIDVLYRIFDANGDDKLSYSEFIAIMNDRLHRGFRDPQIRKILKRLENAVHVLCILADVIAGGQGPAATQEEIQGVVDGEKILDLLMNKLMANLSPSSSGVLFILISEIEHLSHINDK